LEGFKDLLPELPHAQAAILMKRLFI